MRVLGTWICLWSAAFTAGCRNTHPAVDRTQTGNKAPTAAITKPATRTGMVSSAAEMLTDASVPSTPKATREIRVGEVRVIGSGRRFVLIEVSPRPDLPLLSPGLELRTRAPASVAVGGDQTGTLRVSPERRQPFIVADVVDGEPHADDLVYYSPERQLHLVPPILTTPVYPPLSGHGGEANEGNNDPAETPPP